MITFLLEVVWCIHYEAMFCGGLSYLLGDFLGHYGGDAILVVLYAEACP